MIWGRPLMPYMLLWRKPQVQYKLFFTSSDVAGMPFPHSGERGNLLQPTGDSNAAGDK